MFENERFMSVHVLYCSVHVNVDENVPEMKLRVENDLAGLSETPVLL